MPSPSCRLGIDVGGTHTDFVLLDEATGRTYVHKLPSTPQDPTIGIEQGLEELVRRSGIKPSEIAQLIHGTTVPANLLLERRGAKVGLLVTQGFEQILHLARARTPGPLTGWMTMDTPQALVDLALTRGIVERTSARGDAITPLDEAAARRCVSELLEAGAQTLTVCLLHSYANPANELRLRAIIREMDEQVPVSLSCELIAEAGEYERTLATVMNAYIQPGMDGYLGRLQDRLKAVQISPPVTLMRSSGGITSAREANDTPLHALRSGLAGAAVGAARVASLAGCPDALAIDMGGTSTDICLIRDGLARMSNETSLANGAYGGATTNSITLPSLDVRSIGAGGGSIAHSPIPGTLRVGPQSAGALPGPACYGRGGAMPTVTDANVVLGRLPAAHLSLNVQAAQDAVAEFGRELGLDLYRAAEGIVEIANETMAGALRLVAVERRLACEDLALIAFGGAGPMHGCALGTLTGCTPVIVPRNAGVLSALGFLHADVSHQFAHTVARTLEEIQPQQINAVADQLSARASAWLAKEGVAAANQTISFRADVRYYRQGFQVSLNVDPTDLANGGLHALATRLGQAHERRFGMKLDRPVEIITLRAIATAATAATAAAARANRVALPKSEPGGADPAAAMVEQTQVYFDGGFINSTVFDRDRLRSGNRFVGPAIVTERDATTVVHPGHVCVVDDYLNLVIRTESGRSGLRH